MFVSIKEVGQIGLNKDLNNDELPDNAWTDVRNIRFLDGSASSFLGHSEVYSTPSYEPQYLLPCAINSQRYWIYATASKQFATTISGGTAVHTDITNTVAKTGTVNGWTGTLLSGIPILNAGDGASYPMAWDLNLSHKFVDLTGYGWQANTYCKSMRAFKNFLVALNITKSGTNYPYMVKWSHPADPGALPSSWNQADATKLAGEVDLAEGYDQIVDGMQLGNSFMIYKENSTWRMDFSGGDYVFQFTKIASKSGVMNKNCIAEIDPGHIVLTNNDIVICNGQSMTSILDKQTRRWLFQNIDATYQNLCFVFANPYFNEVYICYPSIGATSCDSAVVYNYKDNCVSIRQMPNINHGTYGLVDNSLSLSWATDSLSWDSDETLWNQNSFVPSSARVIMASKNQKLYLLDSTALFDGTFPSSYMERLGLSFEAPDKMKLVRGVRPRITGTKGQTVLISVGGQTDPWATPEYQTVAHTIGTTVADDLFVTGRYIAIKFAGGTANQWKLDSFEVDVQTVGDW